MLNVNTKRIKAYGDRLDDGVVQMSFTFPIPASHEAKEAAKRFAEQMGFEKVSVAVMEPMGESFTFFVVYGHTDKHIDMTRVKVAKVEHGMMEYKELVDHMAENLTRPLVVLGAAIGSDAHTVGIDAIMNMKGYAGDYGLERYPMFKAHNLRSQISTEHLLEKAAELKADAVLISQVVTQRDAHIKNMKDFIAAAKADKRIAKEVIFIVGGPRIEHGLALKHGFDAGFGHGTKPSHVASFIVREYMKRHGMKEKVLEEVPTGQPAEVLQKHHEHKEGHGGRRRRGRRGGRRFRKKHHEAKGE